MALVVTSLRTWLDAFGTGPKTNANGEKVASPITAANSARTPAEGLSDAERIRVLERENAKLREEREILQVQRYGLHMILVRWGLS